MADQSDQVPIADLIGDQAKGHQAALAELGPGVAPGDAEAAQQLVLPIGARPADGAKPAVVVRSGSGRPTGSKNRATAAWARFITAAYGSPLEALASVYAQDVRALAHHLGCTLLDAIKVQIRCAELVAPYVHAKQPIQIDGGGTYAPTSIFVGAQLEPELLAALQSQGVTPEQLASIGRGDFDASAYADQDQRVIEHGPITPSHR